MNKALADLTFLDACMWSVTLYALRVISKLILAAILRLCGVPIDRFTF